MWEYIQLALENDQRLEKIKNIKWLREQKYYDNIVMLASHICQTPISLVTILTKDKQWFKSVKGLNITETDIAHSFCKHTICNGMNEPLIVTDTLLDERFKDNELVLHYPHIRFYCGFPFIAMDGTHIGSMCVIDSVPRELDEEQKKCLAALSEILRESVEIPISNIR